MSDPTKDNQKTYNAALSEAAYVAPYRCLEESPGLPDNEKVQQLAKLLVEQYGNQTQTLKSWRKAGFFTISYTDRRSKVRITAPPLTFDDIVSHLKEQRGFDYRRLGLCPPEQARDNWMDADLTTYGNYLPCNQERSSLGLEVKTVFGQDFPVIPSLDREGFATTSPQIHLQNALLKARQRVLEEAPAFVPQVIDRKRGEHMQFRFGDPPPLAALLEFLNLYVTLVDITLIQAYYGARYDAAGTGLTFNEHVLGPATGRRISDKLRWISALSGKPFNAQKEREAFMQIKSVRNHMVHFDPPCLAVSIDDAAGWLSKSADLGWFLIKIRQCLGVPISAPLIRMTMSPAIRAVPRDPAHAEIRHPQPATMGYISSTWNGSHPHAGSDPLRVSDRLSGRLVALQQRMMSLASGDFAVTDIVDAVLRQRLEELSSLDDAELLSQLGSEVRKR